MSVLAELDATAVRDWARRAVEDLTARREDINALNVFPVADADTGTNMVHTLSAALQAADAEWERLATAGDTPAARDIALALARGAVRGCRGNSGVILAQVLHAVAEATPPGGIDGAVVKRALRLAVGMVERAIVEPVEGTVITVLRAAAHAAAHPGNDDTSLAAVVEAARDAAVTALTATTDQLYALREAGVVDAGGQGFVLVLDALVTTVTGELPTHRFAAHHDGPVEPAQAPAAQHTAVIPDGTSGLEFEVMLQLTGLAEATVPTVRDSLRQLGNSLIIGHLDGDNGRTIHIHTHHPGQVIEELLSHGRPSNIRIDTVEQRLTSAADRAVVALVPPGPLADLYAAAGATVLSDPVLSARPILTAVDESGATEVIILPNGQVSQEVLAAVDTAGRLVGKQLLVLPIAHPIQGLAALAVHDEHQSISVDSYAMTQAALAMRTGGVRADAEGRFGGRIGGETVCFAGSPGEAARFLLGHLAAGGAEVFTIVHQDRDEAEIAELLEFIAQSHPAAVCQPINDPQAAELYTLGVE